VVLEYSRLVCVWGVVLCFHMVRTCVQQASQTKRAVVCTENQVVTAYGMGVAPTVFDRLSAVRSAFLISTIGCSTLFLRYYVDYFME
jgi:hypothetical protein